MTSDSACRSRVGSPLTSMKLHAMGHRLEDDENSAGSCSEIVPFLAGGQLDKVERESCRSARWKSSLIGQRRRRNSSRSAGNIRATGRSCGLWAAIRRTRGLTVKVTSTISSSVGA